MRSLFVLALVTGSAPQLLAQEPAPKQAAEKKEPQGPKPLEAVVRGFYIETRVSGGYMVVNSELGPDPDYQVAGQSESLGTGTMVQLGMGFDFTDNLAFQVLGGTSMVSTRRRDRVRDLSLLFGGAGIRLAVDLSERLDFVALAGGALVRAYDGVDTPTKGTAVLGNLGLEYYVHVRHFSVGLDVSVLAPLSPRRVFVGVGPQLKYTF